jgi:Ca2+-binding EF-hand superfamily protein
MFLDLDGSGSIQYNEFVRKLRRSGVAVRSKEEEIVNKLWNSITKSNLTLEQAFKVFDKDSDNLISYGDMVNAMTSLSMHVEPKVVGELFRIADVTGDGKISNSEFIYIFKKFNKVSYERSEDTHLDWKFDVMAKLDKVSKSKDISLEEIFNSLDSDLDGRVGISEMNELFETLGTRLDQKEFEKLFYAIDTNRSGFISFTEFLAYVNRAKREAERVHRARIIQSKKKQTMSETSLGFEHDAHADPTTRYQLKVSLLEAKEKSAQRQLQKMALKIEQFEEQLTKEEHTVRSLEDANVRTKKEYFNEKQKRTKLESRYQSGVTKEKASKLISDN